MPDTETMTESSPHGDSGGRTLDADSSRPDGPDCDHGTDHEHSHAHNHDEHGHDHGHGGGKTSTRKLGVVAAINVVGFFAELIGGLLFGSVALLSDAVHMLFDALAYVMALSAAYVAERYDVSDRWSYGLHRLEPLSAFLNGVLLFPMVAYILYESYHRFLNPVDIGTVPTVALAGFGLLVNVGSVFVLHGGEMNLNERGAFYHLLGDTGASVAVIISTLAVEWTGVRVVDPLTAVAIALVVAWSALKLLRGSGAIFLHVSPVSQAELRERIAGVSGVEDVLDLHTWQVCSEITVATARVSAATDSVEEASDLTHTLHDELADAGVDHATVELCLGADCGGRHLHAHTH